MFENLHWYSGNISKISSKGTKTCVTMKLFPPTSKQKPIKANKLLASRMKASPSNYVQGIFTQQSIKMHLLNIQDHSDRLLENRFPDPNYDFKLLHNITLKKYVEKRVSKL